MSRVDVPTLKCDRCGHMTQDTAEMGRFGVIRHTNMGGETQWDLCPVCWKLFHVFLREGAEG